MEKEFTIFCICMSLIGIAIVAFGVSSVKKTKIQLLENKRIAGEYASPEQKELNSVREAEQERLENIQYEKDIKRKEEWRETKEGDEVRSIKEQRYEEISSLRYQYFIYVENADENFLYEIALKYKRRHSGDSLIKLLFFNDRANTPYRFPMTDSQLKCQIGQYI